MAKDDELGALWISERGDYMTGKIGDVKVVAFRNDRKKNVKEPDWRIVKSKPRPAGAAQRSDDSDVPY